MSKASDYIVKTDRRKSSPCASMPAILAICFTVIYGLAMAALMFFPMPEGNKDPLLIMFGNISVMLGAAAGYYYQTTQSSKQKDQIISDMVADKSKQDE